MKLRYIFTLVLFFAFSLGVSAETVTAVADGDWNSTATWSTGKVPVKADDVVIPEGLTVTVDAAQVYCNTLKIGGTFTLSKRIDVTKDITIESTGKMSSTAIVKGCQDCYVYGELNNTSRFVIVKDVYLDGGTISAGNSIEISGNLVVDNNSKLTGAATFAVAGTTTFKENSSFATSSSVTIKNSSSVIVEPYATVTANGKLSLTDIKNFELQANATLNSNYGSDFKMKGNVTLAENSTFNIKDADIQFYMSNNTIVDFGGTVDFKSYKSLKVGGYSSLTTNGSGIKINFGENCQFDGKINANFFASPDMIAWDTENVYKHFTKEKRFKLNLYDRPEGEQTFYYNNYGNANYNWKDVSYIWSLVEGHCIYINLAVAINGSKHYYPGLKSGVTDNAVVGAGVTVNVNASVQPAKVTLDKEGSVTNPNNLVAAVLVYVKNHPEKELTFYSEKSGTWSEDEMWTYKTGKHWYVIDADESKYENDNYKVSHDITLDADKTVNTVEINNNATLYTPCDYLLVAKEITEVDGGKQEVTGTCMTWDEITEPEKVDGVVTFWSIGDGEWTDSRNWSVTDPSILDDEGNPIIKTYKGIYPGLDGQKDKVIICGNTTINLDTDYKLYSLEIREDGTLNVANDMTLTLSENAPITINGTMTIAEGKRVTMAGSGHFEPSTGSVSTTSGKSYIRCDWSFLETACPYATGKCSFVNGEDDALAKYTSGNGGEIELTSRPEEFSFAAYKDAKWDEDDAWSVVSGKRIFLYLNDDFTKTISPGENEDNKDSFVIPEDITITHNLKLKKFKYAEIDGTLYLKDQTLYPNNGFDFDYTTGGDGKKQYHLVVIETLRGSGIINEEYIYSSKIGNDEAYRENFGIYILRKLSGHTDFFSASNGTWNTASIWADKDSHSYENRYPGSTNTPEDRAVVRHMVENSASDIALARLTIESTGHLKNGKSIRLVTNDENFVIDGKYEVTENSLMSFVGDGQNLVVNGEIIFDEGKVWSVVGNKFVTFGEEGKFTGKGGIRISYNNIIQLVDGKPHTTFQSILDANPKLDAFLAQGGVMEMTARPNKGYSMDFYLQNDGDWNANKQMWSIGDDAHSDRDNSEENYKVFVYLADQQRYYYPGIYSDNIDRVIICKGKTVNYNIAPDVTEMIVDGTLNVTKSQTMNIVGSEHAVKVGAGGTINIEAGNKLTLTNGIKMTFAEGGQLTGTGTLICYSSAIGYTVTDGEISFETAVKDFVDNGGTLILMDRPSAELTYYSVPTTDIAWNNTKTAHWTLVEGKNVFVRKSMFNEEYYYPCADNVDNAVLTTGTIMTNGQSITLNNFDVRNGAEIILTQNNIKITVDGNLTLNATGKLSANEGLSKVYYRVKSYNNLVFDGKDEDKAKLLLHRTGLFSSADHLFTTNIATHLSANANLWISEHPEGTINFYAQQNGQNWKETDRYSMIPDANVYLYIEGEYYFPGRLSYYTDDAIVIPAGKKVYVSDNINDVKSIGSLHIDGELVMYNNSDKKGRQLKTKGVITGSGAIRCGTYSDASILYVSEYNDEKWKFTGTNELLADGYPLGYIYVTEPKENITYYFAGTTNSSWDKWENWRLDKDLKRVFAFIGGRKTYPASNYETDIAVVPAGKDVIAKSTLTNKKLNGLEVNGTMEINTRNLELKESFKGTGRILSTQVDGIVLGESIADKTFTTDGVMFVTNNPNVFYSHDNIGKDNWGANFTSPVTNWKTDNNYQSVKWTAWPCANVYVRNTNNIYVVPSTANDEVHIVCDYTVEAISTGMTSRTVKNLYVEGGTLNICGGRLVVTGLFVFRAGEVHFCAPTDEWVLNEVDYKKEDDEAGKIKITSDPGDGVMYMTETFLMTQTSWPKAFETYHGKIYLADLNVARKYFLKSGTNWSSAVWTVDRTIDAPGQLVAPNYPGMRFREDEVVVSKTTIDGVATPQHLTQDVNMIVKGIDVREECSLTSAFDMSVDNYVIGGGTLTAKSLTVGGVDILEAPATYTIGEATKNAMFVDGEIILTGNQYANGTLYAKAAGDWSEIKWSLRADGNVYYKNDSQKPSEMNDVVIDGNITVAVNQAATIRNLMIAEGSTLNVCGGDLTVNGEVSIKGDVKICAGNKLIVNGKIVEISPKTDGEGNEESRIKAEGNGTLQLLNSNIAPEIRTKVEAFEAMDAENTNVTYTNSSKYRTSQDGNWNATIWEIYENDTWTATTSIPAAIDEVTIRHNVKVNGSYTIKDLQGTSAAILTMDKMERLNVIGENKYFEADEDGVGEIRITSFDTSNPPTFYAQSDGNWKVMRWAIDPTRKIYSYRNDKYDIPVVTITDAKNINVVVNEGATVTVDFQDHKGVNNLRVDGTLNVNNGKTLTVNNKVETGENGTIAIADGSRVSALLYITNAGTITGEGELMVSETSRISTSGEGKNEIALTTNNGKVLATMVASSATYYSIKDGKWTDTAKNKYVWSIEEGKSVVNYSGSKYNEPTATNSIVITGGTVVTLDASKNATNLTVKKDGILKICSGSLNVSQSLVVEEGGKILLLCDGGTGGTIKTKDISGGGDIIAPLQNKVTITGTNNFEGRLGLTTLNDFTFYFKNGNDCDCTTDNETCRWENPDNWQIDATRSYVKAYDISKNRFFYPGDPVSTGYTYNVVVGSGKSVCLNTDVTINTLTVDGKVNVGELVVEGTSVGESHDEDSAILNVETTNGTGTVTLEYSDNMDVAYYQMQAGTLIIKHYRQGTTYYLLESGGDWTEPYNWTTDPAASTRINPNNSYPGKIKKNDSAVIPSGRVVTMDANTMVDNLTVNGEVLIKNPDLYMLVSNEANGEGKMTVQDINTSFIMVSPQKNQFFKNGTITVAKACDIPGQKFGSLIIDTNNNEEAARLTGETEITNNLEVRSGSTLTLGADITTVSKSNTVIRNLAREGEGMPSEYDVFFETTVGGNVIVEENATLQAAHYTYDVRKVLSDIGGVPTWNVLKVGGSFTVDGELNFGYPDVNTSYTHHSVKEVDNRAIVKFFGSKNSEFIVNNFASMLSVVCDKDESATLYLNKTEEATFDMVSYFCLPDSNYREYPLVLNSGILRLGNHMKIKAWGASRRVNGDPIGVMQYDIYVPGSEIPVYHTNPWSNSEIKEAVRKSYDGTWIDEYKNYRKQINNLGLNDGEWYLNHNKQMVAFDAYEIFKNDLNQGLYIPANATLWIDGAEVEVGRGESTGLKEDGTGQWIGHVALLGKLKITQGGKLILPQQSVGIVYDRPDGGISTPASIYIEDGEIHTSRIYGLRGRKLDFNMEGGALYFDRKTNVNSDTYNDFYTTYGGGDIKQGKPQGCSFSMANGGDFNMSGGLIKFYNKDNAQIATISAMDLNNCGGQITGGTIAFADTTSTIADNFNYSIYLGNHKLHNLTVTTNQSVVFHGNRLSDDERRGYDGNSLYINGNLTINKNDNNRVLIPENLYVGGNMSITQMGSRMPIYGSCGDYVSPSPAPNLYIIGEGNKWLEVVAKDQNCVPLFNSLIIDKTSSAYSFTIKGKPIYILGDLEVKKGQLVTNTTKFTDYRDGVIIGNLNSTNYKTHDQSISVSADGSIADATISMIGNSPVDTDLKVLNNIVVKNFYSEVYRRVFLGSYNFKVLEELKMKYHGENSMFVCTDDNADGGLTLKTTLSAGNMIELPVGVTYLNKTGGTEYTYTRCKATAATAVDGYLTAIPCSNYHPSIAKTETATKFYWRMKWDGTEGDKIFSYDFRLPGVEQQKSAITETQTKRCNINNCDDASHSGEMSGVLANYWEYTHYYQYHDLRWYDCGKKQIDKKSGDGFPTIPASEIMNPNGDFTDGYHFDTVNGPKTYYSVKDGEWSTLTTWSLKENELETPTAVPSVSDRVVIRRGHEIITTGTSAIKAAQIEFVATGSSNDMSTLTVAKTTKNNSVASIIGEGKLIYDVDFDATRDWSVDARLKEVNYLMGDHSGLCDNASSYIVYRNSDADNEFYLPSVIHNYPNLVTEGKVTIKEASAPQGLVIKGNLIVQSGTLNASCASGRKNSVEGKIQVASGATLNVNQNISVAGKVENKGTIKLTKGTMEVLTDIAQNGTMSVGNATISFVGAKESTFSGKQVTFNDGSLLVVNKDMETLTTYLQSKLTDASTGENKAINTSLTRGKVVFNNSGTNISIANYVNGSRMSYFDIPSTLTLDVESGTINLYGTDAQSVKLDGTLIVSNNATLKTANGIGYSSSGSASLSLNNSAKISASQLAPSGESGKLKFSQTSSTTTVTLGSPDGLFDTRYGRLDIRGGDFSQVASAAINIIAAAEGTTPTLYYAPGNSDINRGSAININIPKVDDENPMTTAYVYSEKTLQAMTIGENTEVDIKTRALTYNSTLRVDGSLVTNGYDLTVNGDVAINGQYVHGNNTTIISGSSVQKISGRDNVEFYNLEKKGSAEVQIQLKNPVVTKTLKVTEGTMNLINTPLNFTGNELFVDYGHKLSGKGVKFMGTAQQMMYCEGTISNLNVDNAAGVNAATMQSNPITISGGITLTDGVLRVGANQLVLQNGVKVVNGNDENPFGTTKMIATNLALADMGIRKYVSSSETGNIVLPIGNGDVYSPVTIGITSLTSSNGYFEAKPINDYYMGVSSQTIKEHILDFNWYINTDGISNYKGKVTFNGYGVDVNGYNHAHIINDENKGYVVAVYFDGKTDCDKANTKSSININDAENGNIEIGYSFDGAPTADKPLAGYYLAGCYNELPQYPKAYISVNTEPAKWTDAIWREYDMATSTATGSETPVALSSEEIYGSHVIIDSDVRMVKVIDNENPENSHSDDGQRLSSVKITEKGTLRVGTTRAHYFGVVSGTGTLQIESGNMPSANYESFLDKSNGGTLEFAGSTDYNILYSFTQVRNLVLSGSGTRTFMDARNVKLDIFGNYTVNGPTAKSDADIRLHGQMNVESGSFAGTGTYIFCGNSAQTVTVGSSELALSGVEVSNANGVTVDKPLKISKKLTLTNGILTCEEVTLTSYNATISGSSSSYIEGWLYREMNTGTRYEYYIGNHSCYANNGSRYGRAALEVTSRGVWGVKFHNHSLVDEDNTYYAQNSKNVHLSLNDEYWEVKRQSALGTAYVTVTWDGASVYNGTQNTYQAYYSDGVVHEMPSTWNEATTTAKSGTTSAGEATLKKGTSGFNPATGGSMFFTIGKKLVNSKMWVGTKDDDWFNINNWEGQTLPNSTQDVYITTATFYPVIRDNGSGHKAYANTIWLEGQSAHLTIENGGKLYTNGSIIVEDINTSHITIRHHFNKMSTVKLNGGYFETVTSGKRSKANTNDKVRVELTLQSGRYNYIGSATKEGDLIETTGQEMFYLYDIESDQYVGATKFGADFEGAGAIGCRGYLTQEWTMKQEGTVMASGNVELTVKGYQGEDGDYKWALLSNPFTFTFPLGEQAAINYSDNIDPIIWFRSFDQNLNQFFFSTYNIHTRVGVANGQKASSENNPYMAPQQSFFIRPISGTSGWIRLNGDNASGERSTNLKAAILPADDVVRLVVSSNGQNSDEMAMVFRDGGSLARVYGDATKMSLAATQNQISSVKDGAKMAIPFYPDVTEMGDEIIPLNIVLSSKSTLGYISATNLNEFNYDYDVYLHDLKLNTVVNLRDNNVYTFNINDGASESRFGISLHYVSYDNEDDHKESIPTDIMQNTDYDIMLYKDADNNAVAVVSDNLVVKDAVVNVYDMLGRRVNTADITSTITRVALGENKGVYIVEVISGTHSKTTKMVK